MGLGRFLIWLSGARRQILEECPTDRAKYVGIGTAILVTATLAAISLAFALVTALRVKLPEALPFAIGWGLAILSLDRLFVVSLPRKGTRLAHVARATPRVLLALLLGFVISTPFVLEIFRPEIEHEITVLHAQAEQAYLKSQQSSQLGKDIENDTKKVQNLTAEEEGGSVPTSPLAGQIATLTGQLRSAEAKEKSDLVTWRCELYGGPGCNVSNPGNGPVAKVDHNQYLADVASVRQLTREINADEQQEQANIGHAQQTNEQQARAQLPLVSSKLKAEQQEQAAETATFDTQNTNNAGLLIRMEALSAATAGDSTLEATRWLLFALFVVIDCMPVMIKVMLNLGPENNYDQMLTEEEKKQLKVAAHNRAVRQAAEKLAVETVLGEAQSRLDGWGAPIPEVTRDIIAARTRVEARRVKTWELSGAVRPFDGPAANGWAALGAPGAQPPVGFIAWPWVTGATAPRQWRPVATLRYLALRAWHVLATTSRVWRTRRRTWQGPVGQPYGAPYSPGMPTSPNGVGHGGPGKLP
jgi:hypothetical protein